MTEKRVIKYKEKSKIKFGNKFGRLEVLRNIEGARGHTWIKCRCKCGNIKIVRGDHLKDESTRSCGCLGVESRIKHGMCNTPEYNVWINMIQRCPNPNNIVYKYYGGRGITVCPEWLNSFEAFFDDMGVRPAKLTIDRKNNNLGYFKENCRWATRTEQIRNRRLNKNNKTGISGISWSKQYQKYRVTIMANYKTFVVGVFRDLEQAKAARIVAEQKHWM